MKEEMKLVKATCDIYTNTLQFCVLVFKKRAFSMLSYKLYF